MNLNSMPCPRCSRETDYRFTDTDQNARRYFYKCKNDICRNHWRVVALPGFTPQVTSQSPLERRGPPHSAGGTVSANLMGCPGCGAYGKVKTSYKRDDGYWRRHQCGTCGPYYTCEYEGGVTVHKKLKSLIPIDNS